MIRRSRAIVALGLSLAVGVAAVALADGASDNASDVTASVAPSKLDKKKFKPVRLTSGVTTESTTQFHPDQATEEVYIDYDDDFKINLASADPCSTNLTPLTTAEAKAACPDSIVSSTDGGATAKIPPATTIPDFSVTAFRGVGSKDIILKAYSPSAGVAGGSAPAVAGKILTSPRGGDYGQRLSVPDAPDVAGDVGALTQFNAIIAKKYVKARCHDRNKKFNVKATFVYDDNSEDSASGTQTCKVRR